MNSLNEIALEALKRGSDYYGEKIVGVKDVVYYYESQKYYTKVVMLKNPDDSPCSSEKESHCKECPWKVKNRHNSTIVAFSERTGRVHNCHMTEGVKDIWNPTSKHVCKNFKNYNQPNLEKI